MRFRLHKLLFGSIGKKQSETVDQGSFTFDDELSVSYIRGPITFTRLNDSILVSGAVETATTVLCVRSLEPFELPLAVPLDGLLFYPPTNLAVPEEDADRMISDDGWLDLTETLREEILMAIPINPISPAHADDSEAPFAGALDDLDANDRDWLTINLGTADAEPSDKGRKSQ
jgi:hypothetical protein